MASFGKKLALSIVAFGIFSLAKPAQAAIVPRCIFGMCTVGAWLACENLPALHASATPSQVPEYACKTLVASVAMGAGVWVIDSFKKAAKVALLAGTGIAAGVGPRDSTLRKTCRYLFIAELLYFYAPGIWEHFIGNGTEDQVALPPAK